MISKELKQFIKENKNLINKNIKESWEQIYNELEKASELNGKFTETMLSAGIDPAKILGYIPKYYLHSSNITNYVIPDNVTSIGRWAFSDCSSLTSVVIPNNVTSILWGAFEYCSSLTSVVIPDSVTSIGEGAFAYCDNLAKITLPDSVVSIGYEVFCNCSNLKEIQYKGTKTDALTKLKVKNKNWRQGSSIEKIICTDGAIEL